jgi:hypothetical protein
VDTVIVEGVGGVVVATLVVGCTGGWLGKGYWRPLAPAGDEEAGDLGTGD